MSFLPNKITNKLQINYKHGEVRNLRQKKIVKNEFAFVYIRISHNSKTDYIKTNFQVSSAQVKNMDLIHYPIISKISVIITDYIEKLNRVRSEFMNVGEVKKYLLLEDDAISFSEFANSIIREYSKKGKDGSASNYRNALNSLQRCLGKDNLSFTDVSTKSIALWLKSLENTSNSKNKYPILIKKIFNDGLIEFNDYDNNIFRIKHNPFMKNIIPKTDVPIKQSIGRDEIIKLFTFDATLSLKEYKVPLAVDVAMLVFHLAGINTADLYTLNNSNLKKGKLCYNRLKTKDRRSDKSYIEITIPPEIKHLLKKYKGTDRLFNFSERYYTHQQFNKTVNEGLKDISTILEINKVTSYAFRHSWATIAQNKCHAGTDEIAFCLNHSSAHKVTDSYIEKDFSRIDVINRKVIDYLYQKND